MIAWLATSSSVESSSDNFRECNETDLGVLGTADVGIEDGASAFGMEKGTGEPKLDNFLFEDCVGDDAELSKGLVELAEELCEPVLRVVLP